jgi:hypothetical protein
MRDSYPLNRKEIACAFASSAPRDNANAPASAKATIDNYELWVAVDVRDVDSWKKKN